MRVLVYPHDLALGGSQLNAIEIAGEVRRQGHDVAVFGRPGALVDTVRELGMEFIECPRPSRRPSYRVVRALQDEISRRDIDVVHGYEWPPILECYAATRRNGCAEPVGTVMSMAVAPFIPRSMPLLVGTEQIAAAERALRRFDVDVLEPPVDLRTNPPDLFDGGSSFRERWGISSHRTTVVCVTRLAKELKLEGILTAIDAIDEPGLDRAVDLVIVGDGPDREEVKRRADEVNSSQERSTVILTGELSDPRPAYAAADVVLGMGGSALRGMAFGKPLIVQGEYGFWEALTPKTLSKFLWTGWYGIGSGRDDGVHELHEALNYVTATPERIKELGAFSRETVEKRFSLERAATVQIASYEGALAGRQSRSHRFSADVVASTRFAGYVATRKLARFRGSVARDDFNSSPVALTQALTLSRRDESPAVKLPGPIVYFAGANWDAVQGTDVRLARALCETKTVLWVDPPTSWLRRHSGERSQGPTQPAGLTRVTPIGPPGITKPIVRTLARWMVSREVRRAIRDGGMPAAVIVSSPDPILPMWRESSAKKIYFATDDFIAGAGLMGLSERYVARAVRRNVLASDFSVAVSSVLAASTSVGSRQCAVLPNGCEPERFRYVQELQPAREIHLSSPVAGLIGQLNERIDPELLMSVSRAGIGLLLVGPRSRGSHRHSALMDQLLAQDNVQWVDQQPTERLPEFLAAVDVGLTPYTDTAFNRASFPLKTLEYLAAGLPVVSSNLPASRSLGSEDVRVIAEHEDFGAAVAATIADETEDKVARRQAFAREHSWASRADQLLSMIASELSN